MNGDDAPAVIVIVIISSIIGFLFVFPYNMEQTGVGKSSYFLYFTITTSILLLVIGTGFLIRETPRALSDIVFAVNYFRAKGWKTNLTKVQRNRDDGIIAKIFSSSVFVTLLIIECVSIVTLLFADHESFLKFLNYLFPFSNVYESAVLFITILQGIMSLCFIALAFAVAKITPEIFNEVYGWHVKKHGGKTKFA